MSDFKRIPAVLLSAVMIISLSSCGKNALWAARIDDYEVRSGIFISSQLTSYYDAAEKVSEAMAETETETDPAAAPAAADPTDILNETIDGKPARDWINDEATAKMQEFVAIEKKFGELGLSFENNEVQAAENYITNIWDLYGEAYEEIGISKQSELDITVNNSKKSAIFDYYYGREGEKAISDDEIKQYLYDNFAMIKYIEMPLRDGEENLLKAEGKAEMMVKAEDYLERAENGESFDELIKEFNAFYEEFTAPEEPAAEIGGTADVNEAETGGTADMNQDDTVTDEEGASETTEEQEVDNSVVISKDAALPNQAVVDKIFGSCRTRLMKMPESTGAGRRVLSVERQAAETPGTPRKIRDRFFQ